MVTSDEAHPRERVANARDTDGRPASGVEERTGREDLRKSEDSNDGSGTEKKPGWLAGFAAKLGLDVPTLAMMFKGSLPPTLGIAIYQAPAVSSYFTTLGYLVPIISVLALAVLPRGKFIQNLLLNVLAICVGSAVSMLALWSAVQARLHTTPPGTLPTAAATYNSSQSAVCAVWLFANIWFVNVVRAKLPSFNLPVIVYSILVNISATFGPFMATTAAAQAFIKELLTAMLVALALALGVNLFVFPVSSRKVVFKEFAGCLGLLRQAVALQKNYLGKLESDNMFAAATHEEGKEDGDQAKLTKEAKAAKALQDTEAKLRELAGKLHADMVFAKRDIAWGKLDAKDLSELFTLFRNIYLPILGMGTIVDIFRRVAARRGWDVEGMLEDVLAETAMEKRVWNEVMKQMHAPFEMLSEVVDQGLEHAGLCLELLPRHPEPNKAAKKAGDSAPVDVEARGEDMQPGESGFARAVDEKVQAFYSMKEDLLRTWVTERKLATDSENRHNPECGSSTEQDDRDQAQLYVILYLENLMHASAEAVQNLVAFADKKVEDGTMSKKRLIIPSFHRLRKWLLGIFNNEDSSAEQAPDVMESSDSIVFFGDGYNHKKDPEHLPPATRWQHFGNGLRKVSKFFGSQESAFGFRVACATMTVGIVAFLEQTQKFFMEQRLVWAMIIIAIGMTMTSGQSFFGFLCRVGGTVLAMCFSLVIWYIVDERKPGAIVFLWLSIMVDYYFLLKFPRFSPAVMITIVTQVLIIGYELQVLTIGEVAAARTGQPVYPTYELAPYRLACVAGGSLVAFFWTIFPSPLTERTWLRRDLSATLYLLANYFSVINSTLQSKYDGTSGDVGDANSPAHQLLKVRRKIFGKVMMLVPSMAQHAEWQKWEPTIGGKFPRKAYEDIISRSSRIMGYLTLMSYTLTHPVPPYLERPDDAAASRLALTSGADRAWQHGLEEALAALKPTHHVILSTLTLLSNSLLSGQSLPPFLPLPRSRETTQALSQLGRYYSDNALLARRKDEGDDNTVPLGVSGSSAEQALATRDMVSATSIELAGYTEFAVLQVCSTLVCDDLEGLVKAVSGLVGVVDFSFRVSKSENSSSSSSLRGSVEKETAAFKGGKRGKGKAD
ncbi:hypothetical protein QBC46DRAFT_173564 [Diplogelasinospora grovesii]|uniref:ER transporter 6TM N-terminal domain-containing protein n=1 Tax=Diplogelasinospora grovesii TaxID=303347 RepID=A0AAN6NHT8_9PEZI|nr:hypothetical protein QBC46DRAFT_173564 [Diplogelasinospora grovesii]